MREDPESVDALRTRHYNATLARIERSSSALWILRVRPDRGALTFKPGQYTTLGLGSWEPRLEGTQPEPPAPPRLLKRAYSFSHPVLGRDGSGLALPQELDFHEFYVTLVKQGAAGRPPAFTPRLFARGEGDRLHVGERATGNYTLDPVRPGEDVIFAATGTGEAPHNAMLWDLLRRGHGGRMVSIVCVRYAADLGYRCLHGRLQELFPAVRVFALTTREPGDQGRKMYIQDFVAGGELEKRLGWRLDPQSTHVYLCGNPAMIGLPKTAEGKTVFPRPRGMLEVLQERGFPVDFKRHARGRVHFEEYW